MFGFFHLVTRQPARRVDVVNFMNCFHINVAGENLFV